MNQPTKLANEDVDKAYRSGCIVVFLVIGALAWLAYFVF